MFLRCRVLDTAGLYRALLNFIRHCDFISPEECSSMRQCCNDLEATLVL